MNARWAARIALVIVILLFIFLMMNLQRQLVRMQRTRRTAATSTR